MKPAKKLLNGNVPTRQQYKNWIMPVHKIHNMYASISFKRIGVDFLYSVKRLFTTGRNCILPIKIQVWKNCFWKNFPKFAEAMASLVVFARISKVYVSLVIANGDLTNKNTAEITRLYHLACTLDPNSGDKPKVLLEHGSESLFITQVDQLTVAFKR
ncbi:hypothetical protein TPS_05717 [Trichinella pseudospiralis]